MTEDYRLLLSNLSYFTTESDLRAKFSEFDPLVEVRLARNRDGLSKGRAVVVFGDRTAISTALLALQVEPIDDRVVRCEVCMRAEASAPPTPDAAAPPGRGERAPSPPARAAPDAPPRAPYAHAREAPRAPEPARYREPERPRERDRRDHERRDHDRRDHARDYDRRHEPEYERERDRDYDRSRRRPR
jgi:RNA recognition motif-containing protein